MRPSNNMENKTPLDTYWRVQLGRMTVHAHSSLDPPLEYFWQIKVWYDLFKHFGLTEIWCIFRLVIGKEVKRYLSHQTKN